MTAVSSRGVLEASRSWGRLRGGGEEGTAGLHDKQKSGMAGVPGAGAPRGDRYKQGTSNRGKSRQPQGTG